MDNNDYHMNSFAELMARTNEILNSEAPVEEPVKNSSPEANSRISEVIEIPVSHVAPEINQGEILRPMSYAERLEQQARRAQPTARATAPAPVPTFATKADPLPPSSRVAEQKLPVQQVISNFPVSELAPAVEPENSQPIQVVEVPVQAVVKETAPVAPLQPPVVAKEVPVETPVVAEPIAAKPAASEPVVAEATVVEKQEEQAEEHIEEYVEEQAAEVVEEKPEVVYNTFPETVGLMVGAFFISLWMVISTIAIDIYKIVKSFVLFLASNFAKLFIQPIKDAKAELGEFRIEYLEAKDGVKANLKKSPLTFFPTLNTYRKAIYKNHPNMFSNAVNTILPVLGFVVLVATIGHWSSSTFALEVESSGQTIGYVANEAVYTEATNLVTDRFSTDLSSEQNTANLDTSYKVVTVEPNELTDSETISDSLVESANAETVYACGVYIDGEFICALKTEIDAMQVFNNIIDSYEKTDENDVVGFVEDVQYVQGLYANNEDTIWDSQKLSNKLSEKKSESKYYTVQSGDTLSSIANANGLTVKELIALNPDAEETIHVGDKLLVANEVNYLRLKVVKTEVVTESIAYTTEKKNNSSLYKGTQKVTQKGVKGLDSVTYLVTYVDGVQTSTEEVNRVTLREPTTEKIDVGTKVSAYGAYYGSTYTYNGARLIWPVNGVYTVSSRYGYRSLYGKYGFHGGIDISNGIAGYTVVAAASGTVTLAAATYTGYGNYVMIDHGNGMSTLYGHMLSGSICVKVGQYVSGGQPIGKVGSTGNSTGPHLHFEVRINGTKVNPGPYIGTY